MAWCKGGVVEGNQVHNTKHGGPHQTATGARDLVVRGNVYRNVYKGPYWSLNAQGVQRLVVEDNSIELATSAANTHYAIHLDSTMVPPTYVHGNILIRNNQMQPLTFILPFTNGRRDILRPTRVARRRPALRQSFPHCWSCRDAPRQGWLFHCLKRRRPLDSAHA
jgi:hypothetical protein